MSNGKAPGPNKYMVASKSRLREKASAAGGIFLSDAIERAQGNLDAYRETALRAVDSKIDDLQAIVDGGGERPDQKSLDRIYSLSNELFGESGAFGQTELSQAAYSLCDLIANQRGGDWTDWAPVKVHVGAMRLLRKSADPALVETRRAILDGLQQVSRRKFAAA
jgi:hypothetical protein